jgi:hypothetical protein
VDTEFNLNQCHQHPRKSGRLAASKLYESGLNGIFIFLRVLLLAVVSFNFSSFILLKRSKVKLSCKNHVGAALELEQELEIATFCKRFEKAQKTTKSS